MIEELNHFIDKIEKDSLSYRQELQKLIELNIQQTNNTIKEILKIIEKIKKY